MRISRKLVRLFLPLWLQGSLFRVSEWQIFRPFAWEFISIASGSILVCLRCACAPVCPWSASWNRSWRLSGREPYIGAIISKGHPTSNRETASGCSSGLVHHSQKSPVIYLLLVPYVQEIVQAGPLRYVILNDTPDLRHFIHPLSLSKLAHFLVDTLIVWTFCFFSSSLWSGNGEGKKNETVCYWSTQGIYEFIPCCRHSWNPHWLSTSTQVPILSSLSLFLLISVNLERSFRRLLTLPRLELLRIILTHRLWKSVEMILVISLSICDMGWQVIFDRTASRYNR